MKEYIFEGEIQGKYRIIQIYPVPDKPKHYFIHWDGFKVGIIKKNKKKWFTKDQALIDFTEEIGHFIDNHEGKINKEI